MKAAFEELWHWPEGAKVPFTLLTDHRNLEYIRSAKRLNPWQARWSLFFSHFDVKVTYRPGSKSCKADALSRLHDSSSFLRSINETIILSTLIVARVQWDILTEITEAQANDPTPPSCPNDRTSSSSGHPGITASLQLVSEHFWWPSLEADMITIFQQCPICNMSKSSHQHRIILMMSLLLVCYSLCLFLSSHGLILPLTLLQVFHFYGLPKDIVSDRGPQITSRVLNSLLSMTG